MKRFLMSIALVCVLTGAAMAGEMPTCGVPSPAPGEMPTVGSTAPADMPTCGLSLVVMLFDLAF
jgi:hypothetical protein